MAAEIPLTGGLVAIVDDEDAPALLRLGWRALKPNRTWYAVARGHRRTGGGRGQLMHRLILGEPGLLVDHRNGNGLDNRRVNLRVATKSQNNSNSRAIGGSSRFKGVSFSKERARWAAHISIDGRTRALGRFLNEEQAAAAYDDAAREAFGPFAAVNFPRPGERWALEARDAA